MEKRTIIVCEVQASHLYAASSKMLVANNTTNGFMYDLIKYCMHIKNKKKQYFIWH